MPPILILGVWRKARHEMLGIAGRNCVPLKGFLSSMIEHGNQRLLMESLTELSSKGLPLEDTAESAVSSSTMIAPRNDPERKIFAIWSRVLELSSFGVTDAFYDLGGDSLKAVTMMALVDGEFGVTLPPVQLLYTPTIEKLAAFVVQRPADGKANLDALSVAALRVGQDRPRLFCFPGVGGDVMCFQLLSERLPVGQGVDGVLYPELENAMPPASMKDLAAACRRGIKSVQPEGPYYLGGYSFGGSVAYEVAQQLRSAGEEVAMLALWDADLDAPQIRMGITRLLLNLRGIASWSWQKKLTYIGREFGAWVSRPFSKDHSDGKASFDDVDYVTMRRMVRFQSAAMALHQSYQHMPYDGRILVFCAGDDYQKKDLSYWLKLARGGIEACTVPGDHATLLQEPNVSHLARSLEAHLPI